MFSPILIGVVFSLAGSAFFSYLFVVKPYSGAVQIQPKTYEQCMQVKGSYVSNTFTYPPTCITSDGRQFKKDLPVVQMPKSRNVVTPEQVVGGVEIPVKMEETTLGE